MSASEGKVYASKQTLLRKYDLLVDCLSFEHIESCSSIRELEKILKILRSGEEGCYPHLEKAAEEKLRKLSPNNHLLRVEVPVIPTTALGLEERKQVSNEIQAWTSEMLSKESLLKSAEPANIGVPAVRSLSIPKTLNEKSAMSKSTSPKPKDKAMRKCLPNDYTFWDKFDADSEVLKLDVEEERLAEKKCVERKQREEYERLQVMHQREEEKVLRDGLMDVAGAGDRLTLPEREFNALQEKTKGNEYFASKDFLKALYHYTRSISFLPNVDAYNNRALTHLKLNDFNAALDDCKETLKLDPVNVKGYYRRGVALFNLENFRDALDDFERVLKLDPNDKNTQDYARKTCLKLGISGSSKSVRMNIQTKTSRPVVEEMNEDDTSDKCYPFFNINPNDDIPLNEIGTAKVMCRCNGTPIFMKKVRSLEDIKEHGSVCLRRNVRSQKRQVSLDGQSSSSSLCNFKPNSKVAETNKSSEIDVTSEEHPVKEIENSTKTLKSNTDSSHMKSQKKSENNDALSNLKTLKTPYSFSVFWSSIKGEDDLALVAKALRLLSPDQIAQVVGNKLDEKMLSLFILSLRAYFVLSDEWCLVLEYLRSFTQLPRFSIISMMLDKVTKKELEMLLTDAESLGLRVSDLLQHYGLAVCS